MLIGILLVHYSCNNKTEEIYDGNFGYELEIVDSLMIDFLGSLELISVDADNDLFLFDGGGDKSHLLTVDRSGNIISEFNKPKDAPDAFGQFVLGGTFVDDKIAILGRSLFNIYDKELKLEKSFKKTYPHRGMIYSSFDHLQVGTKNDTTVLLTFTGGPQTEASPNSKNYYQNYNTLDLIDSQKESFEPIIPFHPNSRYAKGEEAYNFIKPLFQVKNNIISFVHQNDFYFYQFDLDNHATTFHAEKIPFDKFLLNKGFAIGGQEDYNTPKDLEGDITQFFQIGDKHLIGYKSGLKLEEMPGPEFSDEERWNKIMKLNQQKYLVRESNGKYSQPTIASNLYRISRADSKGRIWAHQNTNALDYEPDLVTLYELKLVKKELEN
ncbi:hypothetical protein ACFSKL_00635 [Belliella marina]|uniref:6-bladed beta-propeller protein n=1 Tax=Belliella marina TaxID=1644146 RepID=A0ABW4VHK9_9BACT